jgi:hypothetical protein
MGPVLVVQPASAAAPPLLEPELLPLLDPLLEPELPPLLDPLLEPELPPLLEPELPPLLDPLPGGELDFSLGGAPLQATNPAQATAKAEERRIERIVMTQCRDRPRLAIGRASRRELIQQRRKKFGGLDSPRLPRAGLAATRRGRSGASEVRWDRAPPPRSN